MNERVSSQKTCGVALAIVDAVSNDDLLRLGPALRGMLLVLVTMAVIVLSLFISVATRKQITNPLHALSETVQLVSRSSSCSVLLSVPSVGSWS